MDRRVARWRWALSVWLVASCALLWLSLAADGAPGCDTWTGAASESWGAAANWSGGVPTGHTVTCIPGSAHDPNVAVAGHAVAGTVSLGGGAQLTIEAKGSLSVSQTMQVKGAFALVSPRSLVTTPSLNVTRAGTLSGVGAVHGNVTNAGSVTVVDGASGVPLRISGVYRQRRSATILFRDEGGSFTRLHAHTAMLDGGLDMLILDALTPGTKYRLVASATLKGRFVHVVPGYVVRYRRGVATAVVTSQIRLNRSTVAPGTKVSVSGASFGSLGTVKFHLDGAKGAVLGSSSVTSVGDFEGPATIPKNASPGHHVIVAVESPNGYSARAAFTVS